jgi:hypothetical protein
LRHNASLAIEYDTGKKLYLDKDGLLTDDYDRASNNIKTIGTDGKQVAGLEMRCKIQKNSTGTPFRNAKMRFKFDVMNYKTGELVQHVGWDNPFELLEIAIDLGLMETGGGGWHYMLNEKGQRAGKQYQWRGAPLAREALSENKELKDRILSKLYRLQ